MVNEVVKNLEVQVQNKVETKKALGDSYLVPVARGRWQVLTRSSGGGRKATQTPWSLKRKEVYCKCHDS